MRDLTVYDSQGEPLAAEGRGQVNERIKDFFFSGVRMALESVGNGYKLTAFFRARESSASRSEQYYGVLETTDTGELSNFKEVIESHLRSEYGKELVTTKEDTTVFEELSGGEFWTPPGDTETRENVAELVNEGERALVGVGSYKDATTLLTQYLGQTSNPRIVIAENAQSSTLSDYGLVIEKGSYTGLQLLGDTEERIEDMKERKRREREQMLGGGPGGMDPYGTQQQSGPFGLGTRALAGVLAGGAVLLLIFASVGACFLGVSVPVIGGIIPLDCGGGGGGGAQTQSFQPVNITHATVMSNGSKADFLHVEGTLNYNDSSAANGNVTLAYTVIEPTNKTEISVGTKQLNVTDGEFAFNLSENETVEGESYDADKRYNVTITWENESQTVTTPFNASEQTATETGTQMPESSGPTTEPTQDSGPTNSGGTASFNITAISAVNATVGESVEGSLTIENEGTANGTANFTVSAPFYKLNKSITVDTGSSKESNFSLPTDDSVEPGTYNVTASIDGKNKKATTIVKIES